MMMQQPTKWWARPCGRHLRPLFKLWAQWSQTARSQVGMVMDQFFAFLKSNFRGSIARAWVEAIDLGKSGQVPPGFPSITWNAR